MSAFSSLERDHIRPESISCRGQSHQVEPCATLHKTLPGARWLQDSLQQGFACAGRCMSGKMETSVLLAVVLLVHLCSLSAVISSEHNMRPATWRPHGAQMLQSLRAVCEPGCWGSGRASKSHAEPTGSYELHLVLPLLLALEQAEVNTDHCTGHDRHSELGS